MPKKAGRKRKKVTPAMVEEMGRLRDQGLAHQEIAKRLGVAPMTARKYLKLEAPVVPVKKQEPPVEPVEKQERKAIPIVIIVSVVLIIAAVVVASAGYYLMARRGGATGPVVTYTTYTDENYSFKFDYPENWDFSSHGLAELQMYGYFPPMVAYFDASASTGLPGVVLEVYDKASYENLVPGDLDNLTSYVASLENQFENNENYVVQSPPTVVPIDNHNGVRFSFTAPLQQTSENARFELETVVRDNYFYGFEIVAPEENYSSVYKPIFERVIGSFSLLG